MKVSTDACIQGAWAPIGIPVGRVLDVGCGTGLLSLMLSQRNSKLVIDALEVDKDAALQARENVEASPWSAQIRVFETDARGYLSDEKYDMVICNPPFFSGDLQAPDERRNRARHDISLSQTDLFEVLVRNLKTDGTACVLLPATEHAEWESLVVRHGWHVQRTLAIQPNSKKVVNRMVSVISENAAAPRIDEHLIIYQEGGGYTSSFVDLLRPFYLYL